MVSFLSTAIVVFAAATSLLGARATPIKLRAGAFSNQIKVKAGSHKNFRACDQIDITWSDNSTSGPWTVDVGIGGYYQSSGTQWIESYPGIYDQTYPGWRVSFPSGSYVVFQVTNALGEVGYTQNHKVLFKNSMCPQESTSTDSAATSATITAYDSSAWVDNTAPASTSTSTRTSSATHRSLSSTGIPTPTVSPSPIHSAHSGTTTESATDSTEAVGEEVAPTDNMVATAELPESSVALCNMPIPSA